ncbi:carboxylesterase/lipase family protein [Variovorax sp. UMC13]|uniref:carboxylesterase/lipase family protein n=1 Tax=Variovorax sp. UMC13 TaxID=1862326 RepID=UPI0015FEC990|nr:carboxylesterase family protein [Variovorax sp. UMC13]
MCLAALASAAMLLGCGGGGRSGVTLADPPPEVAPTPPDTSASLSGTFAGGPVIGLDYSGSVSGARRTDGEGRYRYAAGETLRFAIGDLPLGSAPAADALSPLALGKAGTASAPEASNRLVLLQTLDVDGDLNNGIQLSDAVRDIVSKHARAIDFSQPSAAFRASLAPLLAALEEAKAFTDLDPRPRTAKGAAAAQEHFARATGARHQVQTTGGGLRGFEASPTTWQYLGIPYAQPPVGALRWRPPQAAGTWNGTREATAWPDQSAQNPTLEPLGEGGMSEDSLYLHVTAPKNASKLPVMVWFHGGSFAILTANSRQYNNPEGLPSKDVVLVTVNHRLGPFGYLAHPLLSAESGHGGSGNYGQMDLVMALQWVQANAAAFGGDPGNVTIFGQSGGGGKVYALMNAPEAAGLFHKAIVQSGANAIATSGTAAASLAGGEAIGKAMFDRVSVRTLAEARALPWTAFTQADLDAGIPRETYRPNVDFRHLVKTYGQNMVDGMPSDVPLMVGATSGDYPSLRAALPVFMAQRTPTYRSPQFVYRFSRIPDGWAGMGVQSGHSGELPYLFNYPLGLVSNYTMGLVLTPDGRKPPIADLNGNGVSGTAGDAADIAASIGWGPDDAAVSAATMTLWTHFAKHGAPGTAAIDWPAYASGTEPYLEIGPGGTTTVRGGLAGAFP